MLPVAGTRTISTPTSSSSKATTRRPNKCLRPRLPCRITRNAPCGIFEFSEGDGRAFDQGPKQISILTGPNSTGCVMPASIRAVPGNTRHRVLLGRRGDPETSTPLAASGLLRGAEALRNDARRSEFKASGVRRKSRSMLVPLPEEMNDAQAQRLHFLLLERAGRGGG